MNSDPPPLKFVGDGTTRNLDETKASAHFGPTSAAQNFRAATKKLVRRSAVVEGFPEISLNTQKTFEDFNCLIKMINKVQNAIPLGIKILSALE
jgi:hypothetical protein